MVNPGHASKGCTTCKLRRIRCDYGRPFCLRCTKSKRICLGYNVQMTTFYNKTVCKNAALVTHPSATTCQLFVPRLRPSLRLFEADDIATQPYINNISYNLASQDGGRDISRLSWGNFDQAPRADREHLVMMVWSMREMLDNAFYSLRQSVQTMEARKDLLQRYGLATRQLREALTIWPFSSALLIPVFHFSLYEMIVNLDPADKTWQTHLNGLLSILQNIPDNTVKFTLVKAIRTSDSVPDVHKALASSIVNDLQRACLLLDIVKLQLRKLAAEIDTVASTSPPPFRKLDMQKLQVSIKRIRKNLKLFPIIIGDITRPGSIHYINQTNKESHNNLPDVYVFTTQWIQFYTLQIMTSTMLLKIGSFLQQDATYHGKREFKALSHIIEEAAEGIRSITTSYNRLCSETASGRLEMSQINTTQALLLIWPLFCVSTAPGLTDGQNNWAREMLWVIGEQCSIPKALSLACSSRENIIQSDILAGILLVNLLSILPNPIFL